MNFSIVHGHKRRGKVTPVYSKWCAMRSRCNYAGNKDYDRYGGRGIKVCERWDDFANFLEDVGEPPTSKHSIERIDVNGNYEPGNVRWATAVEQCNNTRRSRVVEFDGRKLTVAEWARELGREYYTFYSALKRNDWNLGRTVGRDV